MSGAGNHHASCVAFGPWAGILVLGPSGAGKSRLALRLIDAGAQLLADDQVFVSRCDDALYARAPRSIAGRLEVRGLGLLTMPYRRLARLVLAVDLTKPAAARLPRADTHVIAGIALPCVPGQADAAFPPALARYVRQTSPPE